MSTRYPIEIVLKSRQPCKDVASLDRVTYLVKGGIFQKDRIESGYVGREATNETLMNCLYESNSWQECPQIKDVTKDILVHLYAKAHKLVTKVKYLSKAESKLAPLM